MSTALGIRLDEDDPFETADKLCAVTGMPVPEPFRSLKTAPVRERIIVEKENMGQAVLNYFKI